MVVLALPRYAVFKNKYSSRYLNLRIDDKYLVFHGDDVLTPEAKFAIEPESSGSGSGQVHVRSCYNNRYMVRNSSYFVIAGADKPEEDTSKETCTLLEPLTVNDGDSTIIRLRHVQSGAYTCLTGDYDLRLFAEYTTPNTHLLDAYQVIDWESLVIFPPHTLAFKGSNGKYLKAFYDGSRNYLQFAQDDKNDGLASYWIERAGDGSIQLYSNHFQKYLSYNSSWIWADRASRSPTDPKALFRPYKLGSNVIALRSLGNNHFVCGLDEDGKTQCLNARESTITDICHLTVEELVTSRSIHSIVYRQDDARVYNEVPIVCGKGEATNDSNEEDSMEIPINYTVAKSTSWENSVSLEVGVSTTIETGVPFIAEGKIDFSVTVTGGHTWGGTTDESLATGVTYIAAIGPKTHVEVTYVATKGTCDIPFSYTQSDSYSDGTTKMTVMDDGLYTGVNCYNYSFIKNETPL